jgi:hypothetical protein
MSNPKRIIECLFCRARQLPATGHTIKFCQVIKEHICERCGEKGHGPSRCSISNEEHFARVSKEREERRQQQWEERQRAKAEEKSKKEQERAEFKVNCWAGKVAAKIPAAAAAKLAEDDKKIQTENKIIAQKKAEKMAAEAKARREEYEKNYEPNMRRNHGIKKDFVIPAIYWHQTEETIYAGDFWYFRVEDTRDESEYAKKLRSEPENIRKYHAYLAEKYYTNWMYKAEGTADDSCYLSRFRHQEEERREREEWEEEERQSASLKKLYAELDEKQKEAEEMEEKFKKGEITKKVYDKWRWERQDEEWELDDEYHASGIQIWEAMERNGRAEAQWRARDAARQK